MPENWLIETVWLIPALPLAAAIATTVLGPRMLRKQSHWPCVAGSVSAALLSLILLFTVMARPQVISPSESAGPGAEPASSERSTVVYHWITVGKPENPDFDVPVTLRVDPLTALMLVMVTGVGSLIVIYSIGYMHHDPGYWRFFAKVALFLFSMTMLVLASNFLLIYVFWEAVGLCSYLLIGFWYQRPSAAAAAKKAFLVNRIGDVGFALGILLVWVTFRGIEPAPGVTRLDYQHAFDHAAQIAQDSPGVILAICLLLFCGAVGKSAQFPLHVWLPDAMEGPTPVSALIHAATMVTAGVYMVARFTPLFALSPLAQLIVAVIGGFTALMAALIALTQNDLKRILAYSTVSQLGYMFLGLGCGTPVAVIAAIFHVFTHAFFKALLFLGAGSVMHAMGDVIDIRRFSGLRHRLPITCWTFALGAASLAGFPLLSGFWSKDEILAATSAAAQPANGSPYHIVYAILLGLGFLTAFLTAFYTFRAFFKTFWGNEVLPPEAGEHAHESPPVMYYPLLLLAIGSILVGGLLGPTGWISDSLGHTPGLASHVAEHAEHNYMLMGLASAVAVAGIGLAWSMYGRTSPLPDRLAARFPAAYELSSNKFRFDEIYRAIVVRPTLILASISMVADNWLVDGLVNLVAAVPEFFARVLLRPIQNGLVQFYALAMLLLLDALVLALWLIK
ncbi:MAG: NADH-quinone oxidoreductase subunit L [Planctomycetes bacterium]|nr:NADH-quinone oxidoreductase subunit L [Planctomycetota bacterium]